jgi:DNA-binding XRE family transcriptional regulator
MTTVDDLRAQRAKLDEQIKAAARAERLAGKVPPWGPEGAELYRAVGEAIRSIRLAQGMTQQQLATAVGFLRTSVVNIEAGRQRVPLATLYDIADALGVQATALLPRNEDV